MAKGVSLAIFSDTRDFERGIRTGVIDPLEDAQDAVDALADARPPGIGDAIATDVQTGVTAATGDLTSLKTAVEGVHATPDVGDAIATDVDQGVDDARSDLERLEDKMRQYRTTAKTQANLAGNDIGTSVHEGARKAGEGVDGMRDSVKSGAQEIAGSFDGTMEGVAGGVQGVLAEVGAGFGPLGVIVSTGLGLALGGVMSQLTHTQELSDEAKQRISELAAQFIDAGTQGRRSFGDAEQAIKDMATSSDDSLPKLAELWTEARDAGVSYSDLVTALASGNSGDIDTVRGKVEQLGHQHFEAGKFARIAGVEEVDAAAKGVRATTRLEGQLKSAGDEAKRAAEAQKLAAKAGLTEFSLKGKLIEQIHDDYVDASGAVDEYIDDESGLFNVTKYITAMTERQEALRDYQETLATSNLSPAAKAHIEGLGVEQAAAMLAGYKKATPAQQKALNGIWSTAGDKSADSYGKALGDQLQGKVVKGPKIGKSVVPVPDSAAFRRALNTLDNREIAIRVRPKLPNGQLIF